MLITPPPSYCHPQTESSGCADHPPTLLLLLVTAVLMISHLDLLQCTHFLQRLLVTTLTVCDCCLRRLRPHANDSTEQHAAAAGPTPTQKLTGFSCRLTTLPLVFAVLMISYLDLFQLQAVTLRHPRSYPDRCADPSFCRLSLQC